MNLHTGVQMYHVLDYHGTFILCCVPGPWKICILLYNIHHTFHVEVQPDSLQKIKDQGHTFCPNCWQKINSAR